MKNFTLLNTGKSKAMDILNILLITFFIGLVFYFLKTNYFNNSFQEGLSLELMEGPEDILKYGYIPAKKDDIIEVRLPNSDMTSDSNRRKIPNRDIVIENLRTKKKYIVRGVPQMGYKRHYNRLHFPIPHGRNAKFDADWLNKAHNWNHGVKDHPRGKGYAYLPHNAGNQNGFRFRLSSSENRMTVERVAAPGRESSSGWNSDKDNQGRIFPTFSAGWQNRYNFRYQIKSLNKAPPPKNCPKCPDPKTTNQYKALQNKEIQSSNARDKFKKERNYANKQLKKIYDPKSVPGNLNQLKNIPGLEKEIKDLTNKRDQIKKKRDEYRSLYDKALKRINNPIDGDPRGLIAQIEQLKGNAATAKSEYEKSAAAAEARRLAELKKKEEEKAAAAEVAQIRLNEEMEATDNALLRAQKARKQAEEERRQYLNLRKRLEARINQLNNQKGKSDEELFAALSKINDLKQQDLERRAQLKERIRRERADAVADERNLLVKRYRRRLRNRMRRFIRRYLATQERIRQEKIAKQRKRTQELIKLREQHLRQYSMDLHNKQKLEKEEDMLKQVQTTKKNIITMNQNREKTGKNEEIEPSTTGFLNSQPQMVNEVQGNQEGKNRITENRRKQYGVYQSNVYLTVPKDSEKKEVEIGKKTVGGNIFPLSN